MGNRSKSGKAARFKETGPLCIYNNVSFGVFNWYYMQAAVSFFSHNLLRQLEVDKKPIEAT
jgi:hypothetical protein